MTCKKSDGSDVRKFYDKNKDINDVKLILEKAFDFFATEGYTDTPRVNIFKEKFHPGDDYTSVTSYTCYFDGKSWHEDW